MVFTYTEKELREFNIGDNVYSVNPDYAEKKSFNCHNGFTPER